MAPRRPIHLATFADPVKLNYLQRAPNGLRVSCAPETLTKGQPQSAEDSLNKNRARGVSLTRLLGTFNSGQCLTANEPCYLALKWQSILVIHTLSARGFRN